MKTCTPSPAQSSPSVPSPIWSRRLVLATASAWALGGSLAHADQPIAVTTSFSLLADWVRVVGGSRVNVTSLVGPDEDAHVFEPKPKHAKAMAQAQLVVLNGLGFEPWAQKLLKSSGHKGPKVIATQGIQPRTMPGHGHHGHDETDPHAWQNPRNVVLYVRNIADALSKIDPAGATTYAANTAAYEKELQALDTWAQAQVASVAPAQRKVITSHDAFGYLAAHYGIRFLAPQGINTDTEPRAKQVAQLIRQMQKEKIRAVFIENMSSPKLITQITKDTGATLGGRLYADALSAPDQPGATYLQMMRHNIEQLVAGMKNNL